MTRWAIAIATAGLLLATLAARGAPLDKESCAKLKAEEAELEQAGVRASMSRGPEWAKNNLAPAQLAQIRRLIEVEEQLLFRCHGKPLVSLPKDPDPDPAAREPDAKEPGKGAAAKAAAVKTGKEKDKPAPAARPGKETAKASKEKDKDKERPKAPPAKKAAAPADAAPAAPKTKAPAAKPAPKAKSDTPVKKEPPPTKQDAPAKSGEAVGKDGAATAAAAKAKPKDKADDAYRPPPAGTPAAFGNPPAGSQ